MVFSEVYGVFVVEIYEIRKTLCG